MAETQMSDMHSAELSRLASGTRLNGIFEIDHRIASGGMGEIYRGHAVETGDPVAIKVMRTDLGDNAMALALFRKEASALYAIHHEAIIRYYIFSHDPATGRHYLAMEFVDGQPLSEMLHHGPLSFEAVRVLQERLAAGLSAAHQHGIIHRDLSPDNVLIPAGDLARAKIIDFGIARSTRVGDGTIIGSGFAGKYNYVSPEQLGLFGGDVTAKSDIYSLGLVFAECLLGQPIDMGGTQFEVLEKRRVVPDLGSVDQRIRPLLERMLQPDPVNRPESMAAVAAWRPGHETPAPPRDAAVARDRGAGARVPAGKTPREGRPMTKAALALTLLLGIGGAGFYFARDLIWPPVVAPPEPPALNQTAAPVVKPPKPPPVDARRRIVEFVNAYDGGDCFFVTPQTVEDDRAFLEGMGSSRAPFDVFDYEFTEKNGFEPSIGVHQVMPQQCPAINFLFHTRNQPGVAPRLDVDTTGLKDGRPLTGTIADFGSNVIEMLLVGDDGYVRNLTALLKPGGDNKSFVIGIRKTNPGPPRPQLLMAMASAKPLQALRLPTDGTLAEEVFPQVLAEAARTGQAVNVTSRYFMLEK